MAVRPTKVQVSRAKALLIIEWDDGRRDEFSWRQLREACPCAECTKGPEQEETGGDLGQVLIPLAPALPAELQRVEAVGNYALQLYWKDGHSFGIYAWEYLRRLAGKARSED